MRNFILSKMKMISLFMTDNIGSKVVLFLNFKSIISPFGFLQLHCAEKDGMTVPKNTFDLQKNNVLHKYHIGNDFS